jgi:V/A-type H+/Na+-transporting ATPase subunit E
VGYPELLHVLEEAAAREASDVRAAAERESARIVEAARAAASGARASRIARERAEAERARRAAAESLALERERALLVEERRHLEALRPAILAALAAAAGPELDARLLAEVVPEAGGGPLDVVVDPGAEPACRAALGRIDPALPARTRVRAAPAPRGGVEVVAGPCVLDDTLPSRLERAWPEMEAELAAILFGGP